MIDFIWMTMILSALVFSISNGNVSEVSSALFEGATSAVSLSISLLGSMAFWLGISEIMVDSGLSDKITKLLVPIIDKLFPKFKNEHEIKSKISLNITVNLLGLGNAATPLGIEALNEIEKLEGKRNSPSKEAILFVVINTASLQLLPTQMASLRASFGSQSAFSILIPVWVVSIIAMTVVVVMCKILGDLKWK